MSAEYSVTMRGLSMASASRSSHWSPALTVSSSNSKSTVNDHSHCQLDTHINSMLTVNSTPLTVNSALTVNSTLTSTQCSPSTLHPSLSIQCSPPTRYSLTTRCSLTTLHPLTHCQFGTHCQLYAHPLTAILTLTVESALTTVNSTHHQLHSPSTRHHYLCLKFEDTAELLVRGVELMVSIKLTVSG